jgi:hypothetical protein
MASTRKTKKNLKKAAIYQEHFFRRSKPNMKHISFDIWDHYYCKYSVKGGIKYNALISSDSEANHFYQGREYNYFLNRQPFK